MIYEEHLQTDGQLLLDGADDKGDEGGAALLLLELIEGEADDLVQQVAHHLLRLPRLRLRGRLVHDGCRRGCGRHVVSRVGSNRHPPCPIWQAVTCVGGTIVRG